MSNTFQETEIMMDHMNEQLESNIRKSEQETGNLPPPLPSDIVLSGENNEDNDPTSRAPIKNKFIQDALSDFIYGGIDGIITTFSIVAGSAGGELLRNVILILGISNAVSDGFSMGISRYVSSETEIQQGILKNKSPLLSGLITFVSFVTIGLIPLIPFILRLGYKKQSPKIEKAHTERMKKWSLGLALITFTVIGGLKGYVLGKSIIYYSIQVLLLGISASAISYSIGKVIAKYS